jgi:hypothetical protein
MKNEKWQMKNEKWKMENGKWVPLLPLAGRPTNSEG